MLIIYLITMLLMLSVIFAIRFDASYVSDVFAFADIADDAFDKQVFTRHILRCRC